MLLAVSVVLWNIQDQIHPLSMTFLTQQLDDLNRRNARLEREVHDLKERVYLLDHDTYGLEKVAREREWMLKNGEFILIMDK